MGFQERNDAFDFNAAVQDFQRTLKAEKEAVSRPSEPSKDYSLKEGETITVNLKNIKPKEKKPATGPGLAPSGGLLPPPPGGIKLAPPPGSSQHRPQQQQQQNPSSSFDPFA
jgi:hypothetical protein